MEKLKLVLSSFIFSVIKKNGQFFWNIEVAGFTSKLYGWISDEL